MIVGYDADCRKSLAGNGDGISRRDRLESETSLRVRQWLEEFIDCMSRSIERAEIEEEREF